MGKYQQGAKAVHGWDEPVFASSSEVELHSSSSSAAAAVVPFVLAAASFGLAGASGLAAAAASSDPEDAFGLAAVVSFGPVAASSVLASVGS